MFAKKGVELLTYGFGEVENETQWILITHGIDRMFILRVNKISVQWNSMFLYNLRLVHWGRRDLYPVFHI